MIRIFILITLSLPFGAASQVTIQKDATFHVSSGEVVSIEGDLSSGEDISGDGVIILNGNAVQTIDLLHHTMTRLVVQNASNVRLVSGLKVERGLQLIMGHLELGSSNLYLGTDGVVQGSDSSYIDAGSTGKVVQSIGKDVSNLLIPVGILASYVPVLLSSTGKYHNAFIEIQVRSTASPEKPNHTRDYLDNYWLINRQGIEGKVTANAFFAKITGAENNIRPYYWNGLKWQGTAQVAKAPVGAITIDVPAGSGQLYGMGAVDLSDGEKNDIIVSPNPVHSVANIAVWSVDADNTMISLSDSRGILVIKQRVTLVKGRNDIHVNVKKLAAGSYILSTTQVSSRTVQLIKL